MLANLGNLVAVGAVGRLVLVGVVGVGVQADVRAHALVAHERHVRVARRVLRRRFLCLQLAAVAAARAVGAIGDDGVVRVAPVAVGLVAAAVARFFGRRIASLFLLLLAEYFFYFVVRVALCVK